MKVCIEAINLKKEYDRNLVVDGMNFKIREGELVALLGPNGAGKTTTIKMLGGILKPTGGEVKVFGMDVERNTIKVKEKLGVLTEHYSVYESLTAKENLELFAELYNVSNQKKKILDILEIFNLHKVNKPVSTFSKGMKKKLALARSVFHDPEILFLDEPSSDLDPKSASELRSYLKDLVGKKDLSGIICTHNLYDATELCNRYIIVKNGKILMDGSKDDLLKSVKTRVGLTANFIDEAELRNYVRKNEWIEIENINKEEKNCELSVESNECINRVVSELPSVQVVSFGNNTNQIEKAYIKLIGGK